MRPMFLLLVILILAGSLVSCGTTGPVAQRAEQIPMIHSTDLFRPHDDPDDHWDLACVFALAGQGAVDLKLVIVNAPRSGEERKPDMAAVAQMNHITGLHVPVAVGSSHPMRKRDDGQTDMPLEEMRGIEQVLDILRASPRPVIINITGCCRDITVAGARDPELFAEKCAAVYLNAGTGMPDREKAKRLEFNAKWDPLAFAAVFDLPCPVYWMPCFHGGGSSPDDRKNAVHGTYYKFLQKEILPHLSKEVQRFFLYMFDGVTNTDELTFLKTADLGPLDETYGEQMRNMWCTAGFLHAAGKTVTPEGRIVPSSGDGRVSVFSFVPIRVHCLDSGIAEWSYQEESKGRFLFTVERGSNYRKAVTQAMKALLTGL